MVLFKRLNEQTIVIILEDISLYQNILYLRKNFKLEIPIFYVIIWQGGRRHWTVNFTGTQSFIIMLTFRWLENLSQQNQYLNLSTNDEWVILFIILGFVQYISLPFI